MSLSREQVAAIYHKPLIELIGEANAVHRQHNDPAEIQISALVSIKTGACPEDCSYCPQSARYNTGLKVERLMPLEAVVERAENAKAEGSSRLCMGAAWRHVKDNQDFDRVLEMVSTVNEMGMEVCCTLGMLTVEQAKKLANAGLHAYNHNLDTSREFYNDIITTRSFDDRLETIDNVRQAGITVCSGGIIGLGESDEDRISMLHTLASMKHPPESVPINALVPVAGTPMEDQPLIGVWELVRMIATARITMPHSAVRLSAGRTRLGEVEQALCFLAGANSIFAGDKLLTTPNPERSQDQQLFELLGLKPKAPQNTSASAS